MSNSWITAPLSPRCMLATKCPRAGRSSYLPLTATARRQHGSTAAPDHNSLGPGLPLLQGIRVLPSASTQSLVGWQVVTKKRHKQLTPLGTVQQVESTQPSGRAAPAYQLLRVVQDTELQPYGFKGREVHLLPLVPDIVTSLHPTTRVLVATPPEGLLELGRRDLLLSFLSQALLPYAPPARGGPLAAGLVAAGARAITQPRQMPTRAELIAAGRSDLVALILKVGGFTQAALQLGMRASRRPVGYWDSLEVVDMELDAFIAGCWMALPCPDDDQPDDTQAPASHKQQQQQEEEMVMHQRDSIYYYNTATRSIRWTLPDVELFGAKTPPGGGGEPCAEAVLSLPAYQALLDLQQEEEERIMPPSTALTAAGRWDLHQAITQHGGYTAVAAELDRRPCRALPRQLMEPQGLKTALQDVCRQEGWEVGRLPTAQQLRDIDRTDLIRGVTHLGGWRAAADALRLSTTRPTPTDWRQWTISDLAQHLAQFMAALDLTQLKTAAASPPTAAGATHNKRQHDAASRTHRSRPQATATTRNFEQASKQRMNKHSPVNTRPHEQIQRQQKQVQQEHLPTQAQLVAAGRFDLVYALRRFGYEAVREHMGLQSRHSRPKRKGLLQWSAVEAAVVDGCYSCADILAYISRRHLYHQRRAALAGAGGTASSNTELLDYEGPAAGPSGSAAGAAVPLVSREHLQRQLTRWCAEGRLVKAGRACFRLPHQVV